MQLRVQLFANLREFFDKSELVVNLNEPCTVRDLLNHLKTEYPQHVHLFQQVLVAKNHQLAPVFEPLHEEDELALIPPVGGGEPQDLRKRSLLITHEPLEIGHAYELLESPHHGGCVVFTGMVREWTKNNQTEYLEYEAYETMALHQMQHIQSELETRFPGAHTLMWHRVGKLFPTDIAVICGASHAHRDEAFQIARSLIERLKHDVTIWKKEFFRDGNETWQANEHI